MNQLSAPDVASGHALNDQTVTVDAAGGAIAIGLIGVGKIARDQHLPALAVSRNFKLVAAASRNGNVQGISNFPSIERLISETPGLQAVSLCAPPGVRAAMAHAAISAGLAVMLEKPPGVSVSEVQDLAACARQRGVTLFATWHSREAPAVERAREWLKERTVTKARVQWLEDARVWHPGQEWIWQPGGFGVFDPGINALSILTHILPDPPVMSSAVLSFPQNRDMPMRADLTMRCGKAAVEVEFSFDHPGAPCWEIHVQTTAGNLLLTHGGDRLYIDDVAIELEPGTEYTNLYRRFAELIASRHSDVDVSPLQLTADAFVCAHRIEIAPFHYLKV